MQGVQLAHDYFVYLGMPKTQSEVTIYIYHDTEKLISAYVRETNSSMERARTYWVGSRETGIAMASKNRFFVNTSNEWYQNTEPKYRTKMIAHELIHTYQNELSELKASSGSHEVPEAGTRWLREGIAEYLAYKSLSEGGVLSYESERNRFVIDAKRIDKPLSEMEKLEGFRGVAGVYNHFLLAAELLAKKSGESSLLEYHALQDSKTTWQKAFQAAFGMTAEEFYGLFEEHRAAGFPDPEGPTPTATPTITPTPTPSLPPLVTLPGAPEYIKWEIGSEVSLADQQSTRHTVQLMHDYAVSLGLPEIKKDITFYLYHNHDALFEAYARARGVSVDYARDGWDDGNGTGVSGEGYIFVNTSAPWVSKDPLNLKYLTGHELFHGYQHDLSKLGVGGRDDQVPEAGPRWLSEGSAAFIPARALSEAGIISYDTERNTTDWGMVESAKYTGKQPLSEMETWTGFAGIRGDSTDYATMAVELLASLAGESSLIKYYANLKIGTTWQKEFQKSFGMTVDKFYELFEEHRAAGFPDPNRPTPTGPQTVDDYIVWKVGDEVSPTAEAEAREAVLAAHDYAVGIGMPRIDRPITIFLYHNLDSLAAAFEANTGEPTTESWYWSEFSQGKLTIFAGRDWIAVTTSATRYQEWSPDTRKRELAGNLFDVYRRALTRIWQGTPRDAVHPEGPQWLREGSREYLTYQVLGAPGPESCDLTRGRYARISETAGTPLSDAETSEDFWALESSSAHGFLAVELLAEQADPEAVIAYFAALQPGANWQETFHAAFGITIEEFYQLFEERRAAGFPRPRCPTLPPLVTMPGAPEYVKWVIDDEVSEEDRQNAVLAVRLMHDYTVSLGMPETYEDITIYLYHNNDALVAAYAGVTGWTLENSRRLWRPDGAVGNGGKGWAFANTANPWIQQTPLNLIMLIAGEFNNAQKYHLSELLLSSAMDEVPEAGPRWLSSGNTGFLVRRVTSRAGLKSYDAYREELVSRAQRVDALLITMETRTGFEAAGRNPYEYSALAGELLASHAGSSALLHYFTLLRWPSRRDDGAAPHRAALWPSFGQSLWPSYTLRRLDTPGRRPQRPGTSQWDSVRMCMRTNASVCPWTPFACCMRTNASVCPCGHVKLSLCSS